MIYGTKCYENSDVVIVFSKTFPGNHRHGGLRRRNRVKDTQTCHQQSSVLVRDYKLIWSKFCFLKEIRHIHITFIN